ncbi:putative ATP-binding component of an ABC superfamily transporter [Wigglesworthia glossinidia endosymbiont of Glossina morsitans morsitans (Yale colony)]|uniref:Putative ATP-binding component of an ABC superfamily transporter n=1 Tax=Wigglesworthia glossinidia endosymbiont of Glossina morsitans morsitans (Yale colony) TaxID=1142511 RepID=H6Q4Y9_WIGGL|nr:putative ATP-binding component of an ABC superfamily transporter [Wigglesworthia glossinidia endosymbiont of Glossina morsitans morsitans (Yale colony)]
MRVRLGIGYLPQEPAILLGISVLDNLMIALQNRSDLNKLQKYKVARNLMEEFNISHIQKNLGYVLSGGEKRRLEIARTLAIKPKFVLLDEPFSGVDPIAISNIKKIMKILCKKNLGIIITDHNTNEIFSICHRIYIINQGKLVASGSPKIIKENIYVQNIYLGNNV